jgi:hypothetical protein
MSWRVSVRAGEGILVFALWLRDVEGIDVPPSPLVPGPLDVDELPPPFVGAHDPRLGAQWLAWWTSLVDRRPRPPMPVPDEVEPAYDTPDPLGLARLPALRGHVVRRWTEYLHGRTADPFTSRRPPGDRRIGEVVREVEAGLGRAVAPFSLTFTLLPVRDDRIRQVEPAHYLIPERVHADEAWTRWLRAVIRDVA